MSDKFKIVESELEVRFTYHAPKGKQPEYYKIIRATGLQMAKDIRTLCPKCEERELALRKVEEAVMWANAAIARHGKADID